MRNDAVRDDGGVEPISYEDFQVMLRRCPGSAPGPDGLRYGHWAHAGADMEMILYRAYLAVLEGREVPAGFNDGLVVFIPKSPVHPWDASHLALLSQLRPLTFSNTYHKANMECINSMLEPMAQRVVRWSQRGFVRGRQMGANVV